MLPVAGSAAVSVGFVGSACLGLLVVSSLVGVSSLLFVFPACLVLVLLCFLLLLLFSFFCHFVGVHKVF